VIELTVGARRCCARSFEPPSSADVPAPSSRRDLEPEERPQTSSRVTEFIVDDAALPNPVVIAHRRIVVLGGNNQRIHVEIITAGGAIRQGSPQPAECGRSKISTPAQSRNDFAKCPYPSRVCIFKLNPWILSLNN
jgi:hypothetical protein